MLGKFLHKCGGRIVTDSKPVMRKQRKNDKFIMTLAENLSKSTQLKIQQCRLYLNVALLSDICTSEGDKLEEGYLSGRKVRESKLHWPVQSYPGAAAWTEWRKFILRFTPGLNKNLTLNRDRVLGKWNSTHQNWEWVANSKYLWNRKEGQQYALKHHKRTTSVYGAATTWTEPEGAPVSVVRKYPLTVHKPYWEEKRVRQSTPRTFEEYVNSLPPSYRRLVGKVEYEQLPKMAN